MKKFINILKEGIWASGSKILIQIDLDSSDKFTGDKAYTDIKKILDKHLDMIIKRGYMGTREVLKDTDGRTVGDVKLIFGKGTLETEEQ